MVPAESILNFELRSLLLTKSVKTPSAAGLLQMLPRHTKRTENGFVSASVMEGEAMDARIEEEKRVLQEMAKGVVGFFFLRVNFAVCEEEESFGFGERRRSWEQWQNRKLMTLIIPSLVVTRHDTVLKFDVGGATLHASHPIIFCLRRPPMKIILLVFFFFLFSLRYFIFIWW